MASRSLTSPLTAVAPSDSTAPAEESERASALTVQPSATRRRMSAPPTKPEPPVTNAAGMAAKLARARRGEVLLALADDDRLALDEVAHRDLALLHARQRAVAAIVGQPLGAADRGRREAPNR